MDASTGRRFETVRRDRRDALLRELSSLMEVTVREQENGATNIYLAGEPLVDYGRSRGLTTETVSRCLSQLRRSGVIALRDTHTIAIERPEKLERLSEGE